MVSFGDKIKSVVNFISNISYDVYLAHGWFLRLAVFGIYTFKFGGIEMLFPGIALALILYGCRKGIVFAWKGLIAKNE